MKKLALLTTSLTMLMAGCATTDMGSIPDSFTKVDEVAKQSADEIVIPYEKFVLDNGLTVVLHEDKSDPLVHVDVTYHVGSGREEVGKSGFAHFFEHMMFQGSEHVADEEHFKIITEAGGTLNGTTNSDRTNYFQTVPSNQLEKMIWLEADRMGFLLDAVTQDKFEVQRETVKNERGQRVDNAPYGLLFERVGEAMYPEGHPYSWSTIGYIEDLNRVNVNDLKAFFLRWYGPNNATLTIGGDIDKEQTLAWIEKYFGSIPRGPEVDNPEKLPVSLDTDRYISLEDNVSLPLIYMAWPTVYASHPDEAPLDVLMSIMGTGDTSLLYKNLVKNGRAVQAQASHSCRELHCQFALLALPNPGVDPNLSGMEETIRASLAEFEERGVTDDDLQRTKSSIISGMIYGLESVSGKVSQLAFYETFREDPDYIKQDIERYESVTKEDVMRVYEKYIKDQHAVIMSIVPKGQTAWIAKEDTWDRYERTLPDYGTTTADDLDLRIAVDDFDRSVRPSASGDNPSLTLPPVWRSELDNGVKVLGAINDEVPTSAIQLRMKAGQRNESVGKLGLAALTAAMMDETTQKSSKEDISNALQKLGSSISFSSGDTYTSMNIRSLTDNLDETLAIAREKLLMPAFNEDDFNRVKDQVIQGIEFSKKQPSTVATNIFNGLIYGDENSFAYPDSGTVESVASLTLDDVKAFYAAHYSPTVGSIVAVSNIGETAMEAKLNDAFGEWDGGDVAPTTLKPFPARAENTLYLIDKPGAAQSEIRIGNRALPYDATGEYYRVGLMNYALGGAFNSRININLREDKGYTYGARSFFFGDEKNGFYRAQAGVRTDVTDASIIEFIKEIKAYHADGITQDELMFTKNAIGQRDARSYETPQQKLGFLRNILVYDLDDNFVEEQNDILANITEEELDALAAKYLDVNDMIVVVVGDKSEILPGLEELGYDIVMMDEDGNEL
ncbi:pitrilysin family protein [Parvularcula sp. IMCC14364]|uniref:M16 family metallopeptidase n=1 Tax=Parvularcula sp. IMCC14364 TaxID=3067902 RepID=UPI0027427036|nr:pitrilysin family protein [Parvularcula sp. IMCC14364]